MASNNSLVHERGRDPHYAGRIPGYNQESLYLRVCDHDRDLPEIKQIRRTLNNNLILVNVTDITKKNLEGGNFEIMKAKQQPIICLVLCSTKLAISLVNEISANREKLTEN